MNSDKFQATCAAEDNKNMIISNAFLSHLTAIKSEDKQIIIWNAFLTHVAPILHTLVAKTASRVGQLGMRYIIVLFKALQQRIKLLLPGWIISLLRPYEVIEVWEVVNGVSSPLYKTLHSRFHTLNEESPCLDINFTQRGIQVKDKVLVRKKLQPSVWDDYKGVKVLITRATDESPNKQTDEWEDGCSGNRFTIHVHSRHSESVKPYLESLAEKYEPKLYIYKIDVDRPGAWERDTHPFEHPFKLDNLALPKDQKALIQGDLEAFKNDGEFFRSVGKAWKRGYLLHGPPGTGKSSLIASIANYLEYSIYELDLSKVTSDENLLQLLHRVGRGSIIVIEDIDCIGVDLSRSNDGKKKKSAKHAKLSLSGILNALDGLRSGQTDEKLYIFTSNHPEQLDPALLREGRMDMHIELGYCGYEAFMVLLKNYLKVENHHKLPQIQKLIGSVQVTPAAISEMLLRYRTKPDYAMEKIIELLMSRGSGVAEVEQYKKEKCSEPEQDDVSLSERYDNKQTSAVETSRSDSDWISDQTLKLNADSTYHIGASGWDAPI